MEEGLKIDYYYGVQSEQFSFYRIPRLLIKDQHFKGLSSDAKLLYGLMLDRMALSMKNHWLDNENRAYIIYSISNVMEDINCSKPTCVKIMKVMKELDSFGLIERKRKGLGKPDIIYVKNFAVLEDSQEQDEESSDAADTFEENKPVMSNENITSEGKQDELPEVKDFNFNNEAYGLEMVETEEIFKEKEQISPNVGVNSGISKKSELPEVKDFNFWNEKTLTSGGKESLPLEVKNLAPNYNNNNYNNQSYNYINQSNLSSQADQACKDEIDTIGNTDAYIQQIKKNLDYDFYMTNDVVYMDKDLLKELFVIICDVVCTKSETIKISGYVYSCDYVRSKFLRLTSNHVMYVMDCIKNTTTKIANIKAYLLVALFNAPSTIDHYYQQEIRHYADSDVQEVC